MKVYRPYIPLAVRVHVAERQLRSAGNSPLSPTSGVNAKPRALADRLEYNLRQLFGDLKSELHHRPPLVNRQWNKRRKDYDPPANDPDHLVYLLKDEEHRIETYVRGIGAQRSDVSQRRYLKNVAKNRERRNNPRSKKRKSRPIPARVNPWPKRKFGSRK